MEAEKDKEMTTYTRLAQAPQFINLRFSITNYALTKIALEWDKLCQLAPQNSPQMGECECQLLLQFRLLCTYHLYHYYLTGAPIPRSLCHPRWWINGGPITMRDWAPSTDYTLSATFQPQPLFTATERRLLEIQHSLTSKN